MECDIERNMKDCNCTYSCEKKGKCCECIRYHRMRGELPACYFPDDVEKTYDRTVEKYMETRRKR